MGSRAIIVPLRVTLDTNVVISTLMHPYASMTWLRGAWHGNLVLPLRSEITTAELVRVLAYRRFGLTEDRQRTLLDDYLPWCEEVFVPLSTVAPDPRDPNDRPFLELALAGNADALVTGDNDLLALALEFPIPIITPRELRQRLFAGY